MKIFCFRYPRNTVTDILICLLCVFVISLILINADYKYEAMCSSPNNNIIRFLEENGWDADTESGSSSEKTIPAVFDETYEEYALLQEEQGFDLQKYKGRKITVLSYPLRNYPGYENEENIFINILIYNNNIIGADIHSTSINGFITGAVRDAENPS